MTFLSILFFASAFYFAQAKPNWATALTAAQASSGALAAPESPSIPTIDTSAYLETLNKLFQDVRATVDQYMPVIEQIDPSTQDKFTKMSFNGLGSYVDSWYRLLREKEIEDAKGELELHGGRRVHEDDFLEFEPVNSANPNFPYVGEASEDE